MVDFKKRLAKAAVEKPMAPAEIYGRLDRASDKGPLRPAQVAVLQQWHPSRRTERDLILKLHTGQGKTLIGLLMLQSLLNERDGRALYLCANNFLVNQTLLQAQQFGFNAVGVDVDRELPSRFLDGKSILVAPVQKLFNGLTKFGLGTSSLEVDFLILDDAHACIDSIRDACQITLDREHPAYHDLATLFASDLEDQGVGTFADIKRRSSPSFLPVPYWAWIDRHRDVAEILAKHSDTRQLKFVWPLLRDALRDCLCVVSGRDLVIAPYLPPLELFGTYEGAARRVFMSATVTDDSFLVRGLGLGRQVIENPVVYAEETWSGEKMVLIPSLLDESLTDGEIVHAFAKPVQRRRNGVVVLTPGFEHTKDWEAAGAVVAKREDIDARIEELREGRRDNTLVIANRYDGIDLPDATCRLLIIDGKPYGELLLDRYLESCRPGSEAIATRTARIIEQGLGRAVRGEKDYSVVLLSGANLVKAVRTKESRAYFSQQTRTQIELGIEVSELAREDVAKGTKPIDALRGLIRQCLNRDEGWKEFYVERMNLVTEPGAEAKMLDVFVAERAAEVEYRNGDVDGAVATLQAVVDGKRIRTEADKAWYLQEMARYQYSQNKTESNALQLTAHKRNRYLLKPRAGMAVSRLAALGQKRVAAIIKWASEFESYEALSLAVDALLSDLRFGVRAEPFEMAVDALARSLGFNSERPDREWKEGPDNLWALRDGEYMLIECKSEVETTRESINKGETGQMNNAAAWFSREYPGAKVTRVMIIPTRKVGPAAGFNEPVRILRQKGLSRLTRNVKAFYASLRALDLRDLDEKKVQSFLDAHQLRTEHLPEYAEEPRQL
jgi:replicative superfamily II helicase